MRRAIDCEKEGGGDDVTKETYEVLSRPFRRHPALLCALRWGNRILTLSYYLLYAGLIGMLAWEQDERLLRCLFVPGIAFVGLSVFRRWYNAPRPYELGIPALLKKDTKGCSFPSRHVFSAFLIAMTYGFILPWLGGVLLAMGVLLALVRVIGGVHFPKDVLAGALFGIAAGLVGFWLLP